MKQEKPRSLAPRARVCGVHAGRTLEWFYEDCGCCVCALCRTLGPHRGHGIHLMTHGVCHNQELMALYLKDLEERKEQEAGIEQAANDLKMHAIMSKRQLSGKLVELQLLLQEEESLAKNLIDEKTWQVLEAHDQQLQSCQQKFTALETFSCRIRQIQQHSDPVQLLEQYKEIEKGMWETRHLLEQWHPIPFSFEHILNHYKHFMTILQSILQKPLEDQLKKGAFSGLNATAKKEPGTVLKTMSPVDRFFFIKHKCH